jgi:acetylornithine deacetylase/succinyl-diaminopimelate desuccinylase-like protein
LNDLDRIFSSIDEEEIIKLALDMGNIYSPHGEEGAAADYVFNWMRENELEPKKQEVVKDRYNVIGKLRGSGGGSTLIFNGHLDTSQGLPEDLWVVGEMKPVYTKAWREGDLLMGNGITNDKGPVACFLAAAKAIQKSGIKLKGDLILMAVMGEIDGAYIDEYQGPRYLGNGIGTQFAVNNGAIGDYALVAETTQFSITWAECGDVFFKLTTYGSGGIYSPYLERPYKLENNPNAIVKMTKVVELIEKWAVVYQEKNKYQFAGGTIAPKVNIGAIRGGFPVRATQTPGICSVYINVWLPPDKNPMDVQREISRLLSDIGFPVSIESYMYRKGHEGKNVEPLVEATEKAYFHLFKSKPKEIPAPVTSMWRDVNIFNGHGIPAITFGPPRAPYNVGPPDSMEVKDLITCTKLYAMIAHDMCNREMWRDSRKAVH